MVDKTNGTMSEPTLEDALYQNSVMAHIASSILVIDYGHAEALALIGKVLEAQHDILSRVLNRNQANGREVDKTSASS